MDHGDGSYDPFEDEGAIVDLSRYSVRWSTRAMTFSLALPHGSEVSATVQNHWHQIWHYQQGKKWITRTVPPFLDPVGSSFSTDGVTNRYPIFAILIVRISPNIS